MDFIKKLKLRITGEKKETNKRNNDKKSKPSQQKSIYEKTFVPILICVILVVIAGGTITGFIDCQKMDSGMVIS